MIKKAVYLERAPAKINLFLQILAQRPDGYHNLETVFQAIELSDYLTYSIVVDSGDADDIEFNVVIDSNDPNIVALGSDNLVVRGIEIYFAKVPSKQIISVMNKVSIEIFIDKQIPMAAGLAGASADAAATLRILNRFFAENFDWSLSQKELLKLASQLGSDVPFCLLSLDTPRLYAESKGEKFVRRKINFDYDSYANLLVVKPDFGIATPLAYKLFSDKPTTIYRKQLGLYNNFEDVIFENYPTLLEIQEILLTNGAKEVLLSGSGSAMLGFFENPASDIIPKIQQKYPNFEVFATGFLQVI